MNDYVSQGDAANLLDVSIMRMNRWVRNKDIKTRKYNEFKVIRVGDLFQFAIEKQLAVPRGHQSIRVAEGDALDLEKDYRQRPPKRDARVDRLMVKARRHLNDRTWKWPDSAHPVRVALAIERRLEREIEPDWAERKLKSRIDKMLADFDPNDPSWQWPNPEAAETRKLIDRTLKPKGVSESDADDNG